MQDENSYPGSVAPVCLGIYELGQITIIARKVSQGKASNPKNKRWPRKKVNEANLPSNQQNSRIQRTDHSHILPIAMHRGTESLEAAGCGVCTMLELVGGGGKGGSRVADVIIAAARDACGFHDITWVVGFPATGPKKRKEFFWVIEGRRALSHVKKRQIADEPSKKEERGGQKINLPSPHSNVGPDD
ncbi:hypothetical protein FA13DRAFT_1716189 [Coprinellus micaceus]|uniref:Uncharacterized protein n=1 Tax=Coprinellus micaceus TaxID=71717 RepID=A0A4Y7SKH0_COPMI|nr:hypothetical protein FA13DRAFT_1716189 [Coprinellus micaceus]